MFIYFALVVAALLIAAFSGAALSWDGAYVLVRALDDQTPFVAHRRLISIPLQGPVILATRFTEEPTVLVTIFSLAYALVPALSLWASWWIVRDRARHLFVWPALGICLGTLPMQFGFVSEAMMAVQLSWPVMMGVLAGLPRRRVPIVLLFAIAALLAHPFGFVLTGFACASGLAYGARYPASRRRSWTGTAVLTGLTVLSAVLFWTLRSPYEADQMSYETLRHAFDTALAGNPIKSLALSWTAAALIGLAEMSRRRIRLFSIVLWLGALTAIGGAGVLLITWGQDAHSWRSALNTRSWLLALAGPFLVLAALDALIPRQPDEGAGEESWRWRLRAIQLAGLAFMAVLSIQSSSWVGLSSQLETALRRSPSIYVPMSSLGWIRETPLDVWSTTAHSILLQGRTPRKLIVGPDVPADPHLASGPAIAPWWNRTWDVGWFDMRPLRERLVAEREAPAKCWFTFAEGWYGTEGSGAEWWRWSSGDGRLRAHVGSSFSAYLSGGVSSFKQPNVVEVLVNGLRVAKLQVNAPGTQPIESIPVRLKPGRNSIELRSDNQAEKPPADNRLISIAVHGLTLVSQDDLTACELRP